MVITNVYRALLIGFCFCFSACAKSDPQNTSDDWSEDLNYFQQELQKRHINLYHHLGRKEFQHEVDQLKRSVPQMNDDQIQVQLMRISRLVGDGHTQFAFWQRAHDAYPIGLTMVDGALRVTRTTKRHRHLLGMTLHSIDTTPAATVIEKLAPVVQGVENEYSLNAKIGWHASQAAILHGLGIAANPRVARYAFKAHDGEIAEVEMESLPMREASSAMTQRLQKFEIPFGKKMISQSDALWLSVAPESKTAYLYFAAYPSRAAMEKFAAKVRDKLESENIQNLVIDLRNNGGGDFFVGLLLAWQLVLVDNLDWERGVYTLIGNKTFSAGMSNAAQFRQILHSRLIGEPTGGNPYGYQDMDQFELPNSGHVITYSKRNYRFQDSYSSGVQPDVLVAIKWKDLQQGDDRVLDWVLADIASRAGEGLATLSPSR